MLLVSLPAISRVHYLSFRNRKRATAVDYFSYIRGAKVDKGTRRRFSGERKWFGHVLNSDIVNRNSKTNSAFHQGSNQTPGNQ